MCKYDPSKVDEFVGLFVCPYCKEYVVAGEEHSNFEEEMEDLQALQNMNPEDIEC